MNETNQDVWTWEALELNRRALLRYVLAATGNIAAAEDIVQDVLRIAYEKREMFVAGTNLGAWLRGIARNLLKQHFEAQKRDPILVGDAYEELEQVAAERDTEMTDDELQDRRLDALAACQEELGEKGRNILTWRYGEGRSAEVVGGLLRMTVTAVNVTAFRLRALLAECIRKRMAT